MTRQRICFSCRSAQPNRWVSRCEGSNLKRLSHKVEFGVCILKEFWGYGMGKSLLQQSIHWADENEIKKISLQVLETNEKPFSYIKN